jgi:hypothetical protein
MIEEVKVFASLHGSGYKDQVAWFEIRDQNLDVVYYWSRLASDFPHESGWVAEEVPNITVNDGFYVVFYPCSSKEGGVYLHYDLSQVNAHSELVESGGETTNWTFGMPKEKTNWMIRVVGRPTGKVVSISSPPFRKIEGSAEFHEAVDSLDTPEKLSQWMIANINPESHYERWKETGINYIAPPDETFETRLGCCTEFAVFVCYVLQYHNYQAEILVIKVESDESKNHAVCVYHSNGSLNTIDSGGIKGPNRTFKDIADGYFAGWSEYGIYHSWDKCQKLGPPDKLTHGDAPATTEPAYGPELGACSSNR